MKKAFLLLSIILCSFFNIEGKESIPHGSDEIVLLGHLDYNPSPNDVEAYKDETMVGVNFQKNFGNVSITIYNALGQVICSDVVNTAVQQTAIIPFFSTPSGNYRIVLESAYGYAEGEFER